MRIPLLALTVRSLREDSRAWGTHIMRGTLVGIVLLFLLTAHESSTDYSAPGLNFFSNILFANLLILTIVGVTIFSSTVTEEKETGTLGLLKLTGMSPISILLGKSFGLLIHALLLLAIQVPFTLLAVALGGISPIQILAAYVLLGAYTIALCGLGLVMSVIFSRNLTAARAAVAVMLLFYFGPIFIEVIAKWMASLDWLDIEFVNLVLQPILDACVNVSVFTQGNRIIGVGFEGTIINPAVMVNTMAGIVFFVMAWWIFPRATRNEKHEPVSRTPWLRRMRRRSGRTWNHAALCWKEYRFTAGGLTFLLLWFLAYATGFVCFYLLMRWIGIFALADLAMTVVFICLLLLPIHAAWLAGRIFAEEVKGNTLAPLVILPIPIENVMLQKAIGSSVQLIPGLIWLAIGMMSSALFSSIQLHRFLRNWMTQTPAWYLTALACFLILWTAYLSLRVRRGALALAIGSIILANIFILPILMQIALDSERVFAFLSVLTWLACIVLLPMIRHRILQMASA